MNYFIEDKVTKFKNQTLKLLSKKNMVFFKKIGVADNNSIYYKLYQKNIKLIEQIMNNNNSKNAKNKDNDKVYPDIIYMPDTNNI